MALSYKHNELSKKGMKDLGDGTAYAALTVLFILNFNLKGSKSQKIDN